MLKMLNQITGSETDTFDEVNKFLNIQRERINSLIDELEKVKEDAKKMANKNNKYNAKVEKYNEDLKKGGK